jgi:hypothetical protein
VIKLNDDAQYNVTVGSRSSRDKTPPIAPLCNHNEHILNNNNNNNIDRPELAVDRATMSSGQRECAPRRRKASLAANLQQTAI